jgi:hypothetical protein
MGKTVGRKSGATVPLNHRSRIFENLKKGKFLGAYLTTVQKKSGTKWRYILQEQLTFDKNNICSG